MRARCRLTLGLTLDDPFLDAELSAADLLVEEAPTKASVRSFRGVLLTAKGKLERAIADLSYAVDHQAAVAETYYYRGLARWQRQEFKEALNDFNLAADRSDPHRIPAQILTSRGQCYAALGEPEARSLTSQR